MVAFPAVLVSKKNTAPPLLLVIVALPAVLAFRKAKPDCTAAELLELLNVGTFDEVSTMPAPVRVKKDEVRSKVYGGAPALNCNEPRRAPAATPRVAMFDAPKNAVPVGTLFVDQLVPVLKSFEPGVASQVASCATAGAAPTRKPAPTSKAKRARRADRFPSLIDAIPS
jgi:hypothetical protein